MAISIGWYLFEGPYTYPSLLRLQAGIYAVLDDRKLPPVDLGQADNVREAVETHSRYDCWKQHCEEIKYAAFYSPHEMTRNRIEEELLRAYRPVCRELEEDPPDPPPRKR